MITYALPYLAELAMGRNAHDEALYLAQQFSAAVGPSRQLEALFLLARVYHASANWSSLRETCRHIQHQGTRSHADFVDKARLMSARSWSKQQQHEKAARELWRLVSTTESTEVRRLAMLDVAGCYEALQRPDAAVDTYVAILADSAEGPVAETARRRLELVGNQL